MKPRTLAILAGISYIVIFFAAIFANFFVLEAVLAEPLKTIQQNPTLIRFGILAFLITVVFDVVVAWALYQLYSKHVLSGLSTLFRMMHAIIMAVAIFALPVMLELDSAQAILQQAAIFNNIWLIGLFLFGFHLVLLGKIIGKPKWIGLFLVVAGVMYSLDTVAHFMLPSYSSYKSIFLLLVAVPSILGEMSLAVWLLLKGYR